MWGVLPWAFCTISVLFGTILACDPIMLYKRIEGPPLRQQELSPVEGNRRSLNQCSRWCADKPQCYAVTWEPGSCTQVGPGSNGAIVGTTAFIVKRHPYALDPQYSFPMDDIAAGVLVGSVNGDIIGGAQLVGGRKGKALNTNGLDQCVDLGNQRDNCMGNLDNCHTTFVVAMWLRMHRYDDPGANNDEYYITSGGHTDRSMGVALLMREKNIRVIFRTASRVWEPSYATEPKLHTWYHVFLSWSNMGGGKIYINGVLGGEDRLGTSHVNNLDGTTYNKFLLGCKSTSPLSGAGQMTLDDLRIWDVAWPITYQHSWVQYVTDARA